MAAAGRIPISHMQYLVIENYHSSDPCGQSALS
jgi:hypothetical protein